MRAKKVFLYKKYLFFLEIMFAEHALSEEIIVNDVSLGASVHYSYCHGGGHTAF